jgi:hypothetical protein
VLRKEKAADPKTGSALPANCWRDAKVTHEVVNVGGSPLRVIEVEIK